MRILESNLGPLEEHLVVLLTSEPPLYSIYVDRISVHTYEIESNVLIHVNMQY